MKLHKFIQINSLWVDFWVDHTLTWIRLTLTGLALVRRVSFGL